MSGQRGSGRWRHDMKNQLGIILGFSELLLGDLAPEDPQRADVQEIFTAGQRAMALLAEPAAEEDHD